MISLIRSREEVFVYAFGCNDGFFFAATDILQSGEIGYGDDDGRYYGTVSLDHR